MRQKRVHIPKTSTPKQLPDNFETDSPQQQKTTIDPTNHLVASFLGLPREIRDVIYHEIWRSKRRIDVVYQETRFMVEYMTVGSETRPWYIQDIWALEPPPSMMRQPPWFLVNKQVLEEAIEQFHRKSYWVCYGYDKSFRMPMLNSSRFLLNPLCALTLNLGETVLRLQDRTALDNGSLASICPAYVSEQFKHVDLGLVAASNLQELKMSFSLDVSRESMDDDLSVCVNFGITKLMRLQNLRRVAIVVAWSNNFNKCSTAVNQFREQISELGMGLIGGDGMKSFSLIENGIWPDNHNPFRQNGYSSSMLDIAHPRWFYQFVRN